MPAYLDIMRHQTSIENRAMIIITTHHLAGPRGVLKQTINSKTRGDTRLTDLETRDTCVSQMLVFSEVGIIPGKTLGSVFHVL